MGRRFVLHALGVGVRSSGRVNIWSTLSLCPVNGGVSMKSSVGNCGNCEIGVCEGGG